MLLRNLTKNKESKGNYGIEPDCWGYVPDRNAVEWAKDTSRFESMLPLAEGKKNVIIYSGCPIDTTGGGQHPTQIARALVGDGHRVAYFQNKEQPDSQIMTFGTRLLFSLSDTPEDELKKQDDILGSFEPGIVLITFPSVFTGSIIPLAKKHGHTVVYWCLDNWTAIHQSMGHLKYSPFYEKRIIDAADILIATSRSLMHHVTDVRGFGNECHYIQNGYSTTNFPHNTVFAAPPPDMLIGDTTLVYWGELSGDWLDWDLIVQIADTFPDWAINIIGDDKKVAHPPERLNIQYLGEKPVGELMAYGQHAHIGIIPFKDMDVTRAVNPIKAYEYLASGCHVIAPECMGELYKFPNTFLYHSPQKLMHFFTQWESGKKPRTQSTVDFLKNATWKARSEKFLEVTCPLLSQQPSLS